MNAQGMFDDAIRVTARVAALETRLREAEAGRDRLEKALVESQSREVAIGAGIESFLSHTSSRHWPEQYDALSELIASPSPAAEAIGRVLKAVAEERAMERERDRAVSGRVEGLAEIGPRLIEKIRERRVAVDELQAIRLALGGEAT